MLAAINPIDKIFIGVVELLSIVTRTPAFAARLRFQTRMPLTKLGFRTLNPFSVDGLEALERFSDSSPRAPISKLQFNGAGGSAD
jgi:hypothetical protein